MNMLAMNPDPPNPISSFIKTLTLGDPKEPFVLPIVEDSDLELSDLGLEEVFMTNPKEEEEDDVLHPQRPPSPPPIFSPPPFVPDHQTRLSYSPTTDSKHLFTLDNVPPSKWHDEFFNMHSWCIAEKHRYECNQACNSTKYLINILNSQNHLSTKILSTKDPKKTHTHTKQV